MPCPSCSHTMHKLGGDGHTKGWYWCPRCGTVRSREHIPPNAPTEHDDVPLLAQRVRTLIDLVSNRSELLDSAIWLRRLHTMGILEACLLPESRPKV